MASKSKMIKEDNIQYNLVEAFSNSIKPEIISTAMDLGEVALDSLLDSGIVKDIPLLNTVISVFKIGRSVKEAFYIKKLALFINNFNNKTLETNKIEKYKKAFSDNPKKFEKEIERLLILIDRFIDCEKSAHFAKLYIAYLDEKIDWKDFVKYSQVIDQLFNEDLEVLFLEGVLLCKRKDSDEILRLEALGLLVEVNNAPKFEVNDTGHLMMETSHNADEVEYEITTFGKMLADILK